MIQDDLTIRIGGEAGMGLESSGAGFAKALTRGGLYTFGVPDYYSRIRGGHNFFSIRVARQPLYSHAEPVHLVLALDLESIRRHVGAIVEGGAVVHDEAEEVPDDLRRPGVNFFPVPLTALAEEKGGRAVMRNSVILGVAAGLIDFDLAYMESVIRDNFGAKGQKVVDANLRVAEAGFQASRPFQGAFPFHAQASVGTQKPGNAGAVEIHIQQAHAKAPRRKRKGDCGGHRAFSHTPLAAHHQELPPDPFQTRFDHFILLGPLKVARGCLHCW